MVNRLNLFLLIWREMQRSKTNTLLCLIVVTAAAGLFVAMIDISTASIDATRIMMKDMGFNLLVTPQGVDPARYQALDFQDIDMPETYVETLSKNTLILAQHFVGKYQKTVQVDGYTAVLTGVITEIVRRGTEKTPMPTAYTVLEGSVYFGSAIAQAAGKKSGDTVNILGTNFIIGKILDESGAMPEDIRVYAHLHDVQKLLNKPGRINAIDALACQCPVAAADIFSLITNSIQQTLPDVNVKPYRSILTARHQQRAMMQRLEMAALVIVLLGSAAAVWGLTYQNVTNRRHEIGVYRALGIRDTKILTLFLGKSLTYSALGGVLGCTLGRVLALWLNVTATTPMVASTRVLVVVCAVTPLAAMLFSLPPIITRLMQEPIQVLNEGDRT